MSILASTSSASTAAGWGGMIIWLVVLFGFMYFFMIRPQQKEAKKKNAMLSELAVGDTVLTMNNIISGERQNCYRNVVHQKKKSRLY